MAKIPGCRIKNFPADVTVELVKTAEQAIAKLAKAKNEEVKRLIAGLKGELPQIAKDVKSNYIVPRKTAIEDFFNRLGTAIEKANEEFDDTPEPVVNFNGPWTWASASLTAAPKGGAEDLEALIKKSPNVFRSSIGTVIGGQAIKSGTKVKGLNHESSRIDIQSPPKKGVFNVQFQVDKASIACVIFTPEDEPSDVFKYLKESLKKKQKAISPRAQHVIDS